MKPTDDKRAATTAPPREGPALPFLAPALEAGEMGRLGEYRVLRVLGQGGMGMVLLGEDARLRRRVALKVLSPAYAGHAEASSRFLREGRAMAALKHDHIAVIHHAGEDGGVPYLAMELLEGEPLDAVLKRRGRLTVPEVLRFGRQAAVGLEAAHAAGVIHRDIKPSNIWLEGPGGAEGDDLSARRVKLLDFGIAWRPGQDEALTADGAVIGTPAYMAPEQALGLPGDRRADLYALGRVLYEMAAGRRPPTGGKPPSLSEAAPGVPAELSALVARMLAADPEGRPTSAGEVAARLAALEASTRAPRRPWALAIAGGAVIAVALAVAWMRWPPPEGKNGGDVPGPVGTKDDRAKTGTLVLDVETPGSEVWLDGKALGKPSRQLRIEVPAGKANLKVSRERFFPHQEEVTLKAGAEAARKVRLEPDDHAWALWVLKHGGVVEILSPKGTPFGEADGRTAAKDPFGIPRSAVSKPEGLPAGPIWLDRVSFMGPTPDPPVGLLAGVTSLRFLRVEAPLTSEAEVDKLHGLPLLGMLKLGDETKVSRETADQLHERLPACWMVTPFGRRPPPSFDAKAERDLATWVLEREGVVTVFHQDKVRGDPNLTRAADLPDYPFSVPFVGLAGKRITDADLKRFGILRGLMVLDLSGTAVTDAGVEELGRLRSPRRIDLKGTGVTAKGVTALRAALPRCLIVW